MTDLVVVVDGLGFAEAPRWRQERLWFSDLYAALSSPVDPDGSVERVVYVAGNHHGSASRRAVLMIVSSIDRACVNVLGNSSSSKWGTAT